MSITRHFDSFTSARTNLRSVLDAAHEGLITTVVRENERSVVVAADSLRRELSRLLPDWDGPGCPDAVAAAYRGTWPIGRLQPGLVPDASWPSDVQWAVETLTSRRPPRTSILPWVKYQPSITIDLDPRKDDDFQLAVALVPYTIDGAGIADDPDHLQRQRHRHECLLRAHGRRAPNDCPIHDSGGRKRGLAHPIRPSPEPLLVTIPHPQIAHYQRQPDLQQLPVWLARRGIRQRDRNFGLGGQRVVHGAVGGDGQQCVQAVVRDAFGDDEAHVDPSNPSGFGAHLESCLDGQAVGGQVVPGEVAAGVEGHA